MIMRSSFNLTDPIAKEVAHRQKWTAIRQRILLPLNIGEIEWPLRIAKLTEPKL